MTPDADTRPGGGRVSRSAAVIYCTERTARAVGWAVGCREAGARGFDATRIVFMRRVAPNLRAASRRDPMQFVMAGAPSTETGEATAVARRDDRGISGHIRGRSNAANAVASPVECRRTCYHGLLRARRAARILRQRGVSPAAERDILPLPGLHGKSDGPIEADPDDRCRGGVYWSAIVKITSATMMNASTAKKILIQLYGCSPAIDPVTPFTTTW